MKNYKAKFFLRKIYFLYSSNTGIPLNMVGKLRYKCPHTKIHMYTVYKCVYIYRIALYLSNQFNEIPLLLNNIYPIEKYILI